MACTSVFLDMALRSASITCRCIFVVPGGVQVSLALAPAASMAAISSACLGAIRWRGCSTGRPNLGIFQQEELVLLGKKHMSDELRVAGEIHVVVDPVVPRRWK